MMFTSQKFRYKACKAMIDSPYYAAVDLGSNSFHMVIARIQDGQVEIIDRVKEMVQIARGVRSDGYLSIDTQERAIDCLNRFAERLRDIPRNQIRAVGTKALRTTSKSISFIREAEHALGASIQIISGYEEARLVYTGLSHSVLNDHNQRLVIDIGGGSTEFIVGQDYEPILMESLNMGCVAFTQRYASKSEKLTKGMMKKMYLAACAELEGIRRNYLETGWELAYGTSGTVKAIADLLQDRDGGAVISRESLKWLSKEVLDNEDVLDDVPALRRSVLPAGIAILQAAFEQLKIKTLHVADAALKEGLLYDTIGRLSNQDTRTETVKKLQLKYQLDTHHAQRVAGTALYLWEQIKGPRLPGVSRRKILRWAAELHEIGMSVSHSGHHNHGYYILRYSDIAGFGRYEQYILANLVRSQRKQLHSGRFEDMDEAALAAFLPLLVCLRLAILIHRRREEIDVEPEFSLSKHTFKLDFTKGWLEDHPLTSDSLHHEQDQYERVGVGLKFS